MGLPLFKLVFDREKRASETKEGSIQLRITYDRKQCFITTGVRCFPKQWHRSGKIVNRLDAFEMQRTLDEFVTHAKKTTFELIESGELDMRTLAATITGKHKRKAAGNTPNGMLLMDYFRERANIRMYGCSKDSCERYERFLRWFEQWGGMRTFADVTEWNVLEMDKALVAKGLKTYSKWNNYHRFFNSFMIDAREEGLIKVNPYYKLNIEKDKSSGGLGKYLTREEFARIEKLNPPTNHLCHARDLFIFQTYTCLAYTDLVAFNVDNIKYVNGKSVYAGKRGKTNQEFTFLLLQPALRILAKYNGELPLMTNSVYNNCLKAIAVMCGIDKPLSSHWARHTGATMLLNAGMSMEIVAKVLGHSSTRITREVYAKLLDETVANEMEHLEELLSYGGH